MADTDHSLFEAPLDQPDRAIEWARIVAAADRPSVTISADYLDLVVQEVDRLRGIEQRAREYVEAVDRGRQLGVANLGRPILQFQPLRADLGIGPFLGDDDDE